MRQMSQTTYGADLRVGPTQKENKMKELTFEEKQIFTRSRQTFGNFFMCGLPSPLNLWKEIPRSLYKYYES